MISEVKQSGNPETQPNSEQQPLQAGTSNLKGIVGTKLKEYVAILSNTGEKYVEMMKPEKYNEELTELFLRLINDLKMIQLHFSFVVEILENQSDQDLTFILKKYEEISSPYNTLTQSSDVCLVPTNNALETVVTNVFEDLEELKKSFAVIQTNKKEVSQHKEVKAQMLIASSKLETILEYFPVVVTLNHQEIFAQDKSSPVWQKLLSDVQFKEFVDKKALQASIKKFKAMLNLVNAVVYKKHQLQEKMDSNFLANVVSGLSGLAYTAQQEKAETRASLLFAQPTLESAFTVWNVPDGKWVKQILKLRLPSIEYDKKIYVPRLFPLITKDSILKEYQDGTLNDIHENTTIPPDLTDKKEEILKNLFVKPKDSSKVKIRILAPWPLVIEGKTLEKMKVTLSNLKSKIGFKSTAKPDFSTNINGVIVHIHGGGFVSMSSSSHRNYLIRWAKSLNMVIFSIDYRLAPANQYPEPLDDIWQAYNWLINYSESILGIPMDRIVLTGDSAGGNLVASLTLRLIKEGVRIPDGCLLSYPALNLYPDRFVPSYFVAVDDVILPYNVLKLCLKAYIPEEFKPEIDPFLSSIVAEDKLLSKLPPIRIITGTNDPLHDDVWKLLQRLQNLEKDVKVTVYDGMPHGFLSFDEMKGYETIVGEVAAKIQELFYLSEKGF